MFTLHQINEIHSKFGMAETIPQYLNALRKIGVVKYDSFIADGHSEYYDEHGYKEVSSPVHDVYKIAESSDKGRFLEQVESHKKGETDYFEMSSSFAESGIEKWTFDTNNMTLTYYDKQGQAILVEKFE